MYAHVSMLPMSIRLQRDTDAPHRPVSFNQQVESSSPWSVPLTGPSSANGGVPIAVGECFISGEEKKKNERGMAAFLVFCVFCAGVTQLGVCRVEGDASENIAPRHPGPIRSVQFQRHSAFREARNGTTTTPLPPPPGVVPGATDLK